MSYGELAMDGYERQMTQVGFQVPAETIYLYSPTSGNFPIGVNARKKSGKNKKNHENSNVR